ncbi:short-chain fatty acids transporter domain protein [Mycobacterium ulcerans str. Harvey]|uniref:Short-chain fatty acids transporter domain protein n=1 Tax=Mycobacterium ulcerans str. Harvey TaxID=1299332 RepID=A0ABN0QVQ3_MYCUL|nr:short-chain fatty acids transporter domain protein [Mycobacterium ulcerans str. Harvey]
MTGINVPLRLTIFQPYSWVAAAAVLVLLAIAIRRMEPARRLEPDPRSSRTRKRHRTRHRRPDVC